MITTQLGTFKYTQLEHRDDVTSMPLMKNLFGLNNRIYANLGSYGMSDEQLQAYSKHYSDYELRYACLNRLFQVHFNYRDYNDDWHTKDSIDFKSLYELIKTDYDKFERCHAGYYDDGDKSHKELGVLLIPLGSNILYNACNYAAQEFELLKTDNMLNSLTESEHLSNFLKLF